MAQIGTAPAQVRGVIECRAPDGTLKWSVPFTGHAAHEEKAKDGNNAPDGAQKHAG
jgi:hypothetical protein